MEIMGANFEGGGGNKFFNPLIPQFWIQGAENFQLLDI